MKQFIIKAIWLIFPFVFWGCCDESTMVMKYHFFSTNELEDLYMNTDSIMSFQSEISEAVTYEQFKVKENEYSEIDTVLFLSENRDTIAFQYVNSIRILDMSDALSLGYHSDTKTIIGIGLYPIDSCFIFEAVFSMNKPSAFLEDSLAKQIGFVYQGYPYKEFRTYLYKSGQVSNDTNYSIASRETFNLNNLPIENCLFVRFYDSSSNEQAQIVYSNKYGFLKIKDSQHEITRIL